MGMPITSYKVLHLLSDPSAARYREERALLRAIKSYRLLAVVVHDPGRHRELHEVLTSRFGWLDMVTGPALLFFALVEVGEWGRGSGDPLHPLHALEQRLEIEWARAASLPSVDPELSVLTAADRLGISVRDLPCIVVFDVASQETCVVRTSAGTVGGQLQRIALLANNLPRSSRSRERSILGEVGNESVSSLKRKLTDYEVDALETSLPKHASVLSELLESLAPSVSEDDQDARERSRRAVRNLTTTLTELLQAVSREQRLLFAEDERSVEDELGRAAVRLGMAIAMREGGTTQVGWNLPPRDQWELEAAGSLATALKLRALNDPDLILPTVLCYARSFEAEMNASVVQDLRRRLGARMPEHCGSRPTGSRPVRVRRSRRPSR